MSSKRKNSYYFSSPYFDNTVNISSESYDAHIFTSNAASWTKKHLLQLLQFHREQKLPCVQSPSHWSPNMQESVPKVYLPCPGIPVAKQSRSTYQWLQKGYGNPLEQGLEKSLHRQAPDESTDSPVPIPTVVRSKGKEQGLQWHCCLCLPIHSPSTLFSDLA